MKKKTIQKVITEKMEDWLSSIEDKNLRKEVKDNILVSGGSITSMLLGEPVNDYDVYIQDMDVLLRLAEYYCPNKVLDGRKREEYLKEDYQEVLDNDGMYCYENEAEPYVAERYVRIFNLKEDQIKLDIVSTGQRYEIKSENIDKYVVAFLSQNAISLNKDVQIVLRFNGKVQDIHKTFDFIHATNYFTFDEGLVLNQQALESIICKELIYQGSLYPLTSIIRMKKFILRGWKVSAGEMLKVMFQISLLDLQDINTLEEQLIGVDVAYFATLIELLRGVKKEDITTKLINSMIDKVFNEQ